MSSLSDYDLKWNKKKEGNKTTHRLIFHDSPNPKDTSDDEIVAKITLDGNNVSTELYDKGTLLSETNQKIVFSNHYKFNTHDIAKQYVKDTKKFIGKEVINREEH